MDERPVIKLKMQRTDKIIEITGYVLLIGLWVFAIVSYRTLPDVIPIHFDVRGEADGFGDKGAVFGLPAMAVIMFVFLSFAGRKPHTFNYLETITPENAERQYRIATRMMRVLKVIILLIFGLIEVSSFLAAKGYKDGMGIWMLPVFFTLIFTPVAYFLVQAAKEK
jgi:uncharacterized membrane protein